MATKREPTAASIAAKKVAKVTAAHSREIINQLVEIGGRMQTLDDKTELLQAGISDRFGHVEKKLSAVKDLLDGNGTPERGILIRLDRLEQQKVADLDVRVDRLEQDEKRRVWLVRCCIGSTIASIAMAVVELLTHH